jgi:hypothetical protein
MKIPVFRVGQRVLERLDGIMSRLNHDGYETEARHCGRIAVVSLTLSGPSWKNAVELADFKADFKQLAGVNLF